MVRNSNGFVVRSLGEWLFASWACGTVWRRRPNVLVVSIPFVPSAAIVVFASLLRRRPERVLLDVRDLTWEYATAEAPARRLASIVARSYGKLVGVAAGRATLVSCVTVPQSDAVDRLNPSAQVTVVPNGLSREMQAHLAMHPPVGRTGACRFLYAGNIGRAQDVMQLVAFARSSDDVELRFAGDGPQVGELQTALLGLNNASYLGKLDAEELRAAYEWADALVACLRPEGAFQSAIPSKLYEYTATGRLVVFVGEGAGALETTRLGGYSMRSVSEVAVAEVAALIRERRLGRTAPTEPVPVREDLASDLVTRLFEGSSMGGTPS